MKFPHASKQLFSIPDMPEKSRYNFGAIPFYAPKQSLFAALSDQGLRFLHKMGWIDSYSRLTVSGSWRLFRNGFCPEGCALRVFSRVVFPVRARGKGGRRAPEWAAQKSGVAAA
jgi:hypothetical protein